ncbi:bifunctional purine biosynthesis protein PurH [Ktedonobacter sp. SOSP1-85]|uniref:bifunctional phosphoribosylaminoimidazolecarboxamide formyltransferase/IMP cyclohydrolase n=1 Tax=Ktedonobacter sp. SOSP1-85 TaxID=2778367 RepID=UPI0019152A89|nr:bifunctional phosphoribosylaminoimidazolecarboxamide formyltransferase/IMP cyclohydrolase [Ktedonobacter sp. SOSP1-85]GHO75419.1 bifunctional purine biosynthesis protein PurH [Ktedonobacter sp. SOSP1-85]
MRALISVANREGLPRLAQELESLHVSLFSTRETLKALQAAGVTATPVEELTGFPDILEGRVKLLHPALLGGVLARRDRPRHEEDLRVHHIEPIDVVVVNFPPFVTQEETPLADAMEQLDIGGETLLRAAASNFEDVLVLIRPEDYVPVLQEWREQGEVSLETRRRLAAIAFYYLASYDSALASYLHTSSDELFPSIVTLSAQRVRNLRYGENPHQQAALYRWPSFHKPGHIRGEATLAGAGILQGGELSYNNMLDLDTALEAARAFTVPAVAIIKHTNPCGLACGDTLLDAYQQAHAGDPISASGGIVGCNREVDEDTAHELSQLFFEAVIAPAFSREARSILRAKPEMRLLATHAPLEPRKRATHSLKLDHRPAHPLDVRSISGGLLLQTPDLFGEQEVEYTVVTERDPNLEEVTDLMFAWKAVRLVKSNAIVLAHKLALIGVGAGQMNRLASVQLALEKAGSRARGSVLAADAYFPFADAVEAAARAGITAIIQPGGAVRDDDVIQAANSYAIAMVFTGKRHYRH